MIFKYCDDQSMLLLDLKDFIKVLQLIGNEGKIEMEKDYGKIYTTSTGSILRKVIELQQQGADIFFGEKSFEVDDLMRINHEGSGMINILRVTDMQDKSKLVLFIDEAHLIFQEASDALLQQLETVIKLIRSKGVGIFFCTQNPQDIPPSILSQLGLKVQHALRAFTAADRKTIKQAAENFPESEFYDMDELLTQLSIGEALVTLLNEKGIPTPLVHTLLNPPQSRMDILSDAEINAINAKSKLVAKYNQDIDSFSASATEIFFDNPIVKQVGRTAASIVARSLLGALGLGGRSGSGRTSRRR